MQFTEVHRSEFSKAFAADVGTAKSRRTRFFHSCVFFPVLIAAGLCVFGTVRADAETNAAAVIQSQLSPMLDSLTQAAVSMAQQDRSTASTQIRLTISLADGLLSTVQSTQMVGPLRKSAKSLQRAITRFQKRLATARMLVDEPAVMDAAALQGLLNAVSDGQRLRKLMARVPASSPVVTVREVLSRGVGLHYSGEVVCFRVDILNDGGTPSCGETAVAVDTLGGVSSNLVLIGSASMSSSKRFCVTLGPQAGTVRVNVNKCDQSGSILLYNYGVPKRASRTMNPPRNLAAATRRLDTIGLAWSYSGKAAKGFKIERSVTGSGSWVEAGLVDGGANTYEDSGLEESKTYYYRVRAFVAQGYSDYSNTAVGNTTTKTDSTPPSTPTGLNAVSPSGTRIDLSWDAATGTDSGVAQYQVYRDGTLIVTTSNTTYSCMDLIPETQYCFTITASDHMDNVSEQSAPVCRATLSVSAPPPTDVVAPSMPNGVGAVATSATQVTVQWNASTDTGGSGLAGYRVYRGGTQIATVTTTSYTDTGLSPSTQYCYTIRAYDGAGNASSASASACVTTQNPASTTPAAPSNLAAMVVMSTHITLNWHDNSNNETGFRIERAPAGSGPWSVVGTTGVDATSYTDNGLAPSTTYWYRVAAFN